MKPMEHTPGRVLVIEDEPELLEILGDWFDAAGYDLILQDVVFAAATVEMTDQVIAKLSPGASPF